MTQDWKEAYATLEQFVKSSPAIRIEPRLTVIPEGERGRFYELFDQAREVFVREKMPTIWDEACKMSENFFAACRGLEAAGVNQVKTPPELERLLADPARGLIRPLFNPLFDLLKGKISSQEFDFSAQRAVGAYAGPLFKAGYQKWVVLVLLGLAEPDKALSMPYDELQERCQELQPDEKRGFCEYNLPRPKDASVISLGHEGYEPSFVVADVIVRAPDMGRWIAIGDSLTDASWSAKNPTANREWIRLRERGRELKPLLEWPDLALYVDEKPENLGLIIDFAGMLRPDVLIECFEQPNWWRHGGIERAQRNRERFQPRLGSFIVSRHPVPEEVKSQVAAGDAGEGQAAEPAPSVSILEAGYQAGGLKPVMEALFPAPPQE